MKIYKLEVVVIPTNQPCIREDMEDVIYKTMPEKFDANPRRAEQNQQRGPADSGGHRKRRKK